MQNDGRSDLGAPIVANQVTANPPDESNDENVWAALLATATVRVRMADRTSPLLRAFCDTGAQANMISARAFQQLQWPTHQCNIRFNGINGATGRPHTRKFTCELLSRFDDEPLVTMEMVVVPAEALDMWLPRSTVPEHLIPKHIRADLADQNAHSPAPVDILLGAGIWATVIRDGIFTNQVGMAFQPSQLGLLVFGGGVMLRDNLTSAAITSNESDGQLDSLLRRFWEMEEVTTARIRTAEQEQCEENFLHTHHRMRDGRYRVTIPLRKDIKELGASKAIALQRFHQLERKFQRDPEFKQKYFNAMEELLKEGQMQLADREPIGWCYHIPHHAVLKKFRVVFDASCRTNHGISLNDAQLVGEKLQDDLAHLIMRFRCHPVAIAADIRKMYLQVRIHPEQWDLQRVFWRATAQDAIREYWLTTVTFGLASAPHCAVRAMIQAAREERAQFPMGAAAVEGDFYMDDCLTGAQNEDDARQLCREMDALLRSAGFVLDKWCSNRLGVVPNLDNQPQSEEELELTECSDTTVLGLRWLPKTDTLMFKYQPPPTLCARETTKRRLLSHLSQIFDPNGYVGPVVIQAKILMQQLWRLQSGWDEAVSDGIYREWQCFQQQLPLITEIQLPRWMGTSSHRNISLHGFADASELAYGAVLYVRIETTDRVECNLVAAKSRVAPIKTITIPRLELCAAQLLSELLRSFQQATAFTHLKTTLWSDSQIVLAWLVKEAATLKIFVNNRVQKIQRLTAEADWRYVPSADNPADLLSRGVTVAELRNCALWWHGPNWLTQSSSYWPHAQPKWSEQMEATCGTETRAGGPAENSKLRPMRKAIAAMGLTLRGVDLLSRASDAFELCRLTAWVRRYLFNLRQRGNRIIHRRKGPLSNEEVQEALEYWVRKEQGIYYSNEIAALKNSKGGSVDRTSAIFKLDPRLDALEILRVGGRLERALLPFEQRHPAVLPDVSPLARLLVQQAHTRTLHGGQRQMTAVLRQKFWITNLRRLIRTNNSRCISCVRQRQEGVQQIMSDLPSDRVRPCRAFKHSGVDYAGPFMLKVRGGRCKVIEKKWVAVFVCMVTKAVHLELVEDMSTAEFIQAFLRFTSVRGNCTRLWSDNGTNFTGAEKELASMLRSWRKIDVEGSLQRLGTEFRFITPNAPHQGGLWEAAVKSMKYHLRRVIGPHKLTSSAFQTILAQTSAVLNSRPLAALSEDPEDLQFLTPAHLMNGEPIALPFGRNVQDIPDNRLKWAQRIQKMSQVFWQAWAQDYLNEYQQRPKWNKAQVNLKIGDLVVMRDENTPPTLWKMARVIEVFPGADGRVRNVRVKTTKNTYERPVQKLCLLPVDIEVETPRGECVGADSTLHESAGGNAANADS